MKTLITITKKHQIKLKILFLIEYFKHKNCYWNRINVWIGLKKI